MKKFEKNLSLLRGVSTELDTISSMLLLVRQQSSLLMPKFYFEFPLKASEFVILVKHHKCTNKLFNDAMYCNSIISKLING